MKKSLLAAICMIATLYGTILNAHCEIPCGIYNDKMRIEMMKEDVTTLEKSMKSIIEIEKTDNKDYNQLVRWIINKDNHADKIQEVVTQYFMTQRINPDQENYDKKLSILHQMLIYAMKCKQTTDLANCDKLNSLIDQFDQLYFGKKQSSTVDEIFNHVH